LIFVSLRARGIVAAAAAAIVLLVSGHLAHAEPPERMVEFQDGNGSAVVSVESGATAVFYVSDPGLSTVWPGSATWTEIPASVPANSWWSLATGAPHPGVFSILADGYSTSSPALTPLSSVPAASADGLPWLISALDADAGKFALLNDVEAPSTVLVSFDFDIADQHSADERRVKVASGSDPEGEWLSLSEVVSGSDASPSPTSHLFRGEVLLSVEAASVGEGDGAVRVQPGDTVIVTYYEHGGLEVQSSHEVAVGFSGVDLPVGGSLALLAMAIGYVAARVRGFRHSGGVG
jgi:hypothetical protein